MNLFEFLLILAMIALVIIVGVLLFTKKGRLFAKAAIGSLFTDANKNPKIMAQYYDQKRDELQKYYNKAQNAYNKASGEKIVNDKKIAELKKQLSRTNTSIIEANRRGDITSARIFANEAMSIESELKARQENVPVLEDAMRSSSDMMEKAQVAIKTLETRKKSDISKVETGKVAQEIYSQCDPNRVSSEIDKILNEFSEYADDQDKMGIGAKAAYENSYEARLIAAEKANREYQADDYISNLIESVGEPITIEAHEIKEIERK